MRRSLSRKPKKGRQGNLSPEAARLLAEAGQAMRQHQPSRAMHCLERVLKIAPNDAMAYMGLGMARHELGHMDGARQAFERACALAPESAACWFNLGKSLKQRDHDTERACVALERALALEPGHVAARLTLADARISQGNVAAGVAEYREVLRRQPGNHRAWFGLANAAGDTFTTDDVSALRSAWHAADPSSEAGIMLGFAAARALETVGKFDAAFAALADANAARKPALGWDAPGEAKRLEDIATAFPQPAVGSEDSDRGNEVIFVVSLPRAGSTLVEQILASHPEVEGAGEVLDLQQVIDAESSRRGQAFPHWVAHAEQADWVRLGEAYLQRTAHWREQRSRFTDKNLLNWQLVGAAMAMLPGARFINVRRDPVETCLACYRQLFRTGNGFSYDLADMADYWQGYDRLCRHWQQLYPRRFADLEYEALVAQPEVEIRQLLDHCGLDFRPECLDFHKHQRVVRTASAAQVRQPLRSDTARASRYGEALAPLRDRLQSGRKRSDGEAGATSHL
ncbi:MAG: tetratricopeptide repeat protein [Rhodanobacteraceae bacterium]